jgi:hypothetical protein
VEEEIEIPRRDYGMPESEYRMLKEKRDISRRDPSMPERN